MNKTVKSLMRPGLVRRTGLLTLLAALMTVTSAQAAPGDAALAEGLFTSGKEAMARGDLQVACTRFAESLKLDPAIGTLLNLAACEERSGKLTSALEHFTSARGQLPKDDFRIKFTTEQIDTLAQRVARVTVRPPPLAPGTRVLRDGVELPASAFDVPLPMDPGAHAFVVESSGAAPSRTELTLREGETRVIDLRAAPPAAPPVVPAAEPTAPRTLAFVVTGVGVAGLATGAVTGLLAIGAAGTYRDHCTNGVCDPEGLSAASTGKTMSIVSPIAFAVGIVGVGVGAYLFLSAPAGPARRASTAVVPMLSPSVAGLSLARSF